MKKILFLSITNFILLNAGTSISIGTLNGDSHIQSGNNSTMNITNNKITEINKDNIDTHIKNVKNNINKDNVETHIETHLETIENDIDTNTEIKADTINGNLQSTSGSNSDIKNKDDK